MSGHSKWSTIKRQKAAVDSKRGKIFTKVLREIQVAARIGGGSLDGNYRLRRAVDSAKEVSVPVDNIDKAIKRGTGELEGVTYEEIRYEGYGPGGVGILIDCLTDNKVRTVADVRNILTRNSGSLASTNAVAYQFSEKGLISIPKANATEDKLFELALEAGAEDITDEGDSWEIKTEVPMLITVFEVLQKNFKEVKSEIKPVPSTIIKLSGDPAKSMLQLLESLDEYDDVQSVVANFDMDESEMLALS